MKLISPASLASIMSGISLLEDSSIYLPSRKISESGKSSGAARAKRMAKKRKNIKARSKKK